MAVNLIPKSAFGPTSKGKYGSNKSGFMDTIAGYVQPSNFLSSVSKFAPGIGLADNVVNAFLTSNTPEPPRPELVSPAKLKTNVNTSPQREAVDRRFRSLKKNFSDSGQGPAGAVNLLAGMDQANVAKNQIYSAELNQETNLINQDALNRQKVDFVNTDRMNKYNQQKYERELGIQSDISGNVSNAVDDILQMVTENNQKGLDISKLLIGFEKYKGTAVWDDLLNNPIIRQIIEGNPELKERLNEQLMDAGRDPFYAESTNVVPAPELP